MTNHKESKYGKWILTPPRRDSSGAPTVSAGHDRGHGLDGENLPGRVRGGEGDQRPVRERPIQREVADGRDHGREHYSPGIRGRERLVDNPDGVPEWRSVRGPKRPRRRDVAIREPRKAEERSGTEVWETQREIPTPSYILFWLKTSKRGQKLVYHFGNLAVDADPIPGYTDPDAVARRTIIYKAHKQRKVQLTQKRLFPNVFAYIATRI